LSEGRVVVTYFDGSWTDQLRVSRYGVRATTDGVAIRLEVEPRPARKRGASAALAEFIAKREELHVIQIGTPRFASTLRSKLRTQENARLGLCVHAGTTKTSYPVAVVFGPDEVTLNVG
jgi:hypothetical protein